MSRRNKRPVEKLDLTYGTDTPSEDIREVYSAMFAGNKPQVIEFPPRASDAEARTDPNPAAPVSPAPFAAADSQTGKAASDVTTQFITSPVDMTGDRTTPVVSLETNADNGTTPVRTTGDITVAVRTTPDGLGSIRPTTFAQPAQTLGNLTSQLSHRTTGDKTTPVKTAPIITTPAPSIPEPSLSAPVTTAPVAMTPAVMHPPILADGVAVQISGRPYNIHRCRIAQDGHSRSEQVLYDILWRLGKPIQPDDSFRYAMVPMKDLADVPALRMTQKNLRLALQRLVEKLSIEEAQTFDPKAKTARVWKVYSYRKILERRKAAGMEWVVRDRGVRFIDPTTTPVKPTPVVMLLDDITTPVTTEQSSPVKPAQTTGVTTDLLPLGLFSRTVSLGKQPPSTSGWTLAIRALYECLGQADDDAVLRMAHAAFDNTPDVTDEELAHVIREEVPRVLRNKSLDNPIGMLIRQVPRRLAGESLRILREQLQRQRAEQQRYRESQAAWAQGILEDPKTPESDREWARGIVEEHAAMKKAYDND